MKYTLALVGASGMVGNKLLRLLEKKYIPIKKLIPLGSKSAGQKINYLGNTYEIIDLDSFQPADIDITIFAAGSDPARDYAQKFLDAGSYIIDLSSYYRYENAIPLVIPAINESALATLNKPCIIANPNCTTAQLLMVLKPIHDNFVIKNINLATYQAVSGTGVDAIAELNDQIQNNHTSNKIYPKPIAFNAIPQCDIFLDNFYTKEEMKVVWETHKILDKNIHVNATCVRIPVRNGHSEAVFMRLENAATREDIIHVLHGASGVAVMDHPDQLEYPTPLEQCNDSEDVYVGRIRVNRIDEECWASMWIVADNVYGRGAALNAIEILESLIKLEKI
ncbi:MAG: aspartate-semialdehyde dehydrogenase [Gammaproteobacteria bacterium]